jgi:hypothetical protein
MPTLTEWFFDPRIDYASQTQLMADLCDLAMTMTRRIYENTITRPGLISVGALGFPTSLTFEDGEEIFLLINAGFEHKDETPVYVHLFIGNQELIQKKGKELTELLNKSGEIYNTKVAGPN